MYICSMEDGSAYTLQRLYWKYVNDGYLVIKEGKRDEIKAWRYFINEKNTPNMIFQIENKRFGFLLPRRFNINDN